MYYARSRTYAHTVSDQSMPVPLECYACIHKEVYLNLYARTRNSYYARKAFTFFIEFTVDLYTLRLLVVPKTCSKVTNSMFATHCTVDTLDVVHSGRHAVTISEIHTYQLLELHDDKVSFYGVTPFYLIRTHI